jgi:16S rRNA (adenine1518-N6/adenine1519-N6)-dimethyltransferase
LEVKKFFLIALSDTPSFLSYHVTNSNTRHMNHLTDPHFIKDLFRHYQLKPKDYMGQNFLVDEIALEEIVRAGDLKKTDIVVEVGPGLGVLTQQLAARAGKVIAIEKDRTLVDILNFNMQDHKNFILHNQDVLRFNLQKEIKGKYKVVANIPYYLTSKLIEVFLSQENKPELMVFLIQKEVGERIVAKPGALSLLGLSVQFFADAEILYPVPQTSFWPQPKVESVVIKIVPRHKYDADPKTLFRIAKAGFSGKRKQLHNTLSAGLKIPDETVKHLIIESGLDPAIRPQELSIGQWLALAQKLANYS